MNVLRTVNIVSEWRVLQQLSIVLSYALRQGALN